MRSLRPSPTQIDAALERYLAWRQASAAVRYTYGVWLRVGSEERQVSAGNVIFVAAEVEHRFYEIAEELIVLVFFAPAESEEAWKITSR